MLSVIIVAIVVASAIWVYLDATSNKIGKIPDAGGMFNMSAGAWSVVTLLLWVIGFPAYLVKRSALIEKAKQTPIEVRGRNGKAVSLGIVGGLWFALSLAVFVSGDVPACDAPEVVSLATESIREAPLIKLSGFTIDGLSMPAEVEYNTGSETRRCRAQLSHALGKEMIEYTVQWHDKAKGIIYVEISGDS